MFTINAEVRKEQGKGASRRLRAANKFPAIVYGGKKLRLLSNWTTTSCGTSSLKLNSMMKFRLWLSMAKK
jgi:hypothetical protein